MYCTLNKLSTTQTFFPIFDPQEAAHSMHRVKAILIVCIIFGFGQSIAQTQRLSPDITASETEVCENDEVQLNLSTTTPENTSVQFDGASHQIVFPSDPVFDFGASANFTVEFFMKQDNPAGVPQSIISKGDVIAAGFGIGINGGLITVGITDGTNAVNFSGFTQVSDGAWHHVAVVFDRLYSATLYVDGIYDNDANISGVGDINNTDNLFAAAVLNAGIPSGFYGGYLDELRIWTGMLTISELISRSVTHLNPSSFTNLIGYWDFNDLSAPQVLDCSPTGATGTMINGVALPPDAPALAWPFTPKWSTGQNGQTTIFVNPTDTTTYKVEIGYCKYYSVDSITIAVVPCEDIDPATRISSVWVPNAFTPNGDQKNDEFLVKGSNLSSYEIMIFNRLGNIVYHSKNILNAWDGTLDGKVLKDDVYTYVINFNGYNNVGELQQFQKYGTVTILH